MSLPSWATSLRPTQVTAIQSTLAAFSSGSSIVILDAPTGSGKTLIADQVAQSLQARSLYLCNSISLQHQFARDFPSAAIIKGRTNYPTADAPRSFPELNAGDCNKVRTMLPDCANCESEEPFEAMHCKWCHPVSSCPYEQAKATALRSPLVCTNTSYFLYEANYVGNLPLRRDLIVIDEADTLEDTLLSFVEVRLTERRAKEYGIEPPTKKTVESSWVEWAQAAADTLRGITVRGDSVEAIRNRTRLTRLRDNIRRLNDPETGLQAGGWVYTGYQEREISFKPIVVDHLAKDYLWKHCKRFLLMSATTISFDVMAQTLGIE